MRSGGRAKHIQQFSTMRTHGGILNIFRYFWMLLWLVFCGEEVTGKDDINENENT